MLITSPEVCELVGCSYRQLDYWERQGIIRCARPATGVGSSRGWTREEAALVRACLRLAELGASGKTLRMVGRALGRRPELWDGQVVVNADGKVSPVGERVGGDGWIVDLAACRRWVSADTAGLAQVS